MITPVFHSDTAKGGVRVAPRRARFAVVATLMAAALAAAGANQALARAAPESFADLAEKLSPSVVNVSTTQKVETSNRGVPEFRFPPGSPFEEFFKEFFDRNRPKREGPARRRVTSLGSGFIIDSSGLIVTNNHVIADADEIAVRLADGRKFDAEVIGKDPKTDLALLKIKQEVNLPALAPVDRISETAADITVSNLSRRITVATTGDALERLSRTLNEMLERLETSVARIEQFSADASHEMRTPLAVIRTTAELANRHGRTEDGYRLDLLNIQREAEHLT